MVDYTSAQGRTRDLQDHTERGLWGSLTYQSGAGAHMTVRGTGTVDEEVPLLNMGYTFNLAKDSNAEVVMLALGSDPNDKVALATIARDLQYQWGEGQGGIQHPLDPSRRIEFNGSETWIKDGTYVLGHDRAVTVSIAGSAVTISMTGNQTVNIAGNSDVNVAGNATINAGGTTAITSGGGLSITAPTVAINSATLQHNGTNVGDTHRHGGIFPGGGNTGVPT